MTVKIDHKIVNVKIVKDKDGSEVPVKELIVEVDPKIIKRPKDVHGKTVKLKPPYSEHALYMTLNYIEVMGEKRPLEIFLNSRNMQSFQWIVTLTRVISAVFRTEASKNKWNGSFLLEELKTVFDPKGSYRRQDGKLMPSLVAEIGYEIELWLYELGCLKEDIPSEYVLEKRKEAKDQGLQPHAVCETCHNFSMVNMGGCSTCIECGSGSCS